MEIVLATRNKKKVGEMIRMSRGLDVIFHSLDEFPNCPEVEEDGRTFKENAMKKARIIAECTDLPALADDSGLEVTALFGAPGVYSARFAGEGSSDEENVKKLLREMRKTEDRSARFVCCLALAFPDETCRTFSGSIKGTIGKIMKGANGFGYDPVFFPAGHQLTFAELSDSQKDSISHRGKALSKFFRYLRKSL